MIKFDLICENQHIFEASFDDSNSFEKQKRKKQIECPFCNSSTISKSVMAPNISGKSTSSAKINREKKKLFSNYNKQLTEKESQELVDEGIGLVRLPFSKKEKNKN